MARNNQESVYLSSENQGALEVLLRKYPTQSKSAFINAALRFYIPYAVRGLDGNLQPYTLENGPKLPSAPMMDVDTVKQIVSELIEERDVRNKNRDPQQQGGRHYAHR